MERLKDFLSFVAFVFVCLLGIAVVFGESPSSIAGVALASFSGYTLCSAAMVGAWFGGIYLVKQGSAWKRVAGAVLLAGAILLFFVFALYFYKRVL